MRSTAPLCEVHFCAVRGRHAPDCPDPDECWGCLRRQAGDGRRICDVHAGRLAEDVRTAPELHEALGMMLIRKGRGGEKTSGSSAGAPVPDDDVMDARELIRLTLIGLVKTIVTERGIHAPQIQRHGRWFFDTRPQALARFIDHHVDWLAAHRRAADHAVALHEATRGRVQSMAYPAGNDKLYIGECPLILTDLAGNESVCGTRLYQHPDRPLLECAGCGTQDTIEQWVRWMVPEASGVTDAYALAAHLALKWMRPVDPALIRQWSHRGHISPVTVPEPTPTEPGRKRVVRDDRNRSQYCIAEVVAYATKQWGPPFNAGKWTP